jgi:hypothetical protein
VVHFSELYLEGLRKSTRNSPRIGSRRAETQNPGWANHCTATIGETELNYEREALWQLTSCKFPSQLTKFHCYAIQLDSRRNSTYYHTYSSKQLYLSRVFQWKRVACYVNETIATSRNPVYAKHRFNAPSVLLTCFWVILTQAMTWDEHSFCTLWYEKDYVFKVQKLKSIIHKVNIPYYNVYTSFWDTLYKRQDGLKQRKQEQINAPLGLYKKVVFRLRKTSVCCLGVQCDVNLVDIRCRQMARRLQEVVIGTFVIGIVVIATFSPEI